MIRGRRNRCATQGGTAHRLFEADGDGMERASSIDEPRWILLLADDLETSRNRVGPAVQEYRGGTKDADLAQNIECRSLDLANIRVRRLGIR
jgi:hypothetical protein